MIGSSCGANAVEQAPQTAKASTANAAEVVAYKAVPGAEARAILETPGHEGRDGAGTDSTGSNTTGTNATGTNTRVDGSGQGGPTAAGEGLGAFPGAGSAGTTDKQKKSDESRASTNASKAPGSLKRDADAASAAAANHPNDTNSTAQAGVTGTTKGSVGTAGSAARAKRAGSSSGTNTNAPTNANGGAAPASGSGAGAGSGSGAGAGGK
ncbi:MAG: hypothetical protein NVS3B20_04020 [Polyangiales bacterium]